MSVLDRFLNAMKMNDDTGLDDEYLDDGYGDDFDDYEEDRPKKRIFDRYQEEADESGPETEKEPEPEPARAQTQKPKTKTPRSGSKISPMRSAKRGNGMEICVIKPRSMEDAKEVTETLLDGCSIVLNLLNIDFDLAQRIIDFSCGSCYAIDGNLQLICKNVYLITPKGVEISGDFQEMISDSFDVPTLRNSF